MPTYDEVIHGLIPRVEYHQNRYARGLSDVVKVGNRWLDVGSGTHLHGGWKGPTEAELAERASVLIGCDLIAEHVRRNRSLTNAVVADITRLPFREASFDIVTANMVVEHLETPEVAFREIADVLAVGGRFVFVTPNRSNPFVWAASIILSKPARKRLAKLFERRKDEDIFFTFYRANSRSAIGRLANRVGLTIMRLDTFNSYPFVRRPWPATAIESLWIRLIDRRFLRTITTNLFAVLQKNG